MPFDQKGFYREVGLRIQLVRKRAEMTQEALSGSLGISRASYANVESGRQRIPLDLIWKISVLLGVSIQSLVPEPLTGPAMPVDWLSATGDIPNTKAIIARNR